MQEDAEWIWKTGKELGLVHMAGSSVPHCFWRDPWLQHPPGTAIRGCCMLSYGDLEAYGYHGMEALEAMIERRPGGETGVVAIQSLAGDALWAAAAAGKWPWQLATAALEVVDGDAAKLDSLAVGGLDGLRSAAGETAALFVLEHADGFVSCLLHAQGAGCAVGGWAYAAEVPVAGGSATEVVRTACECSQTNVEHAARWATSGFATAE